jgi:hypothetical protein
MDKTMLSALKALAEQVKAQQTIEQGQSLGTHGQVRIADIRQASEEAKDCHRLTHS